MNRPTLKCLCQCEPSERWSDRFVVGELCEEEMEAAEHHLNHCENCQKTLDQDANKNPWCQDVRTFLNDTLEGRDQHQPNNSSWNTKTARLLERLAPTDNPEMLGRLAGYEVKGVIGLGGMGIVLKAHDVSLDRYVAIKCLSPELAVQSASRRRFAREAKATAAVVHDNVIAIHSVDEYDGTPFLVMPYVRGESLQHRIDRSAPMSVEEILSIALQIARGLAAAHDQGLIHRDIKPSNILMPENVERIIITDFGLARAVDDASVTQSGVLAGTPQYMSPEQARGRNDRLLDGSFQPRQHDLRDDLRPPAVSCRKQLWRTASDHRHTPSSTPAAST